MPESKELMYATSGPVKDHKTWITYATPDDLNSKADVSWVSSIEKDKLSKDVFGSKIDIIKDSLDKRLKIDEFNNIMEKYSHDLGKEFDKLNSEIYKSNLNIEACKKETQKEITKYKEKIEENFRVGDWRKSFETLVKNQVEQIKVVSDEFNLKLSVIEKTISQELVDSGKICEAIKSHVSHTEDMKTEIAKACNVTSTLKQQVSADASVVAEKLAEAHAILVNIAKSQSEIIVLAEQVSKDKNSSDTLANQVNADASAVATKLAEAASIRTEIAKCESEVSVLAEQVSKDKKSSESLAKQVSSEASAVAANLGESAAILKQTQSVHADSTSIQSRVKTLADQVATDKQAVLATADSLYAALAEVKSLSDKVAQAEIARNEQAAKLEAKLESQAKQAEAKIEEKSLQLDAALTKLAQQQSQHASFFGRLKWLVIGG